MVHIPDNYLQFVSVTCAAQRGSIYMTLYEPLENGNPLPPGVLASIYLVSVQGYVANVPMVIISEHNVFLQSRLVVGTLCQVWPVRWPGKIIVSRPGSSQNQHATVSSQVGGIDEVTEAIHKLNFSHLTLERQSQVRDLLSRSRSVFSANDCDLRLTELITHEIPLTDSTPVRQRYRRIPPSDYAAVKKHVQQLLASQVILGK